MVPVISVHHVWSVLKYLKLHIAVLTVCRVRNQCKQVCICKYRQLLSHKCKTHMAAQICKAQITAHTPMQNTGAAHTCTQMQTDGCPKKANNKQLHMHKCKTVCHTQINAKIHGCIQMQNIHLHTHKSCKYRRLHKPQMSAHTHTNAKHSCTQYKYKQ